MKDSLLTIIRAIVDKPDAVSIDEQLAQDGGTLYLLHVAPEDMGKIIGKAGKTIRAIRTLMSVRAAKEQTRVYVELSEVQSPLETK